jgi:hypothetical protein
MKILTSFLFVLILSTSTSFSQASYTIGYAPVIKGDGFYIDNNDKIYSGKMALRKTYVDLSQVKAPELKIKTDGGEKQVVALSNIKKIVIEKDTFIVVKDYLFQYEAFGSASETIVPYDFIEMVRYGKIEVFEHHYCVRGFNTNIKDAWLQKGDKGPVKYFTTTTEGREKVLELLKDKPAIIDKWQNMKRRELMKYMNSNPYQMIDDYNSASL